MNRKPTHLPAAFRYAFEGIGHTIKTQRSMRIHCVAAALALICSAVLRLSALEWAAIIICIGLVMASEIINTALESLVDLASPELDSRAKIAKDAAAGAVLVFSFVSFFVGLIIFISAFLRLVA
jgi:diacylglycerol kinase